MKCKGCGKEVDKLKAKGLCGACYVRLQRYGSTEPRARPKKGDHLCSKCHRDPVHAKGLCKVCYGKDWLLKVKHGKCKECGENKKIVARGLCHKCYSLDIQKRKTAVCRGCGKLKPIKSRGLCVKCAQRNVRNGHTNYTRPIKGTKLCTICGRKPVHAKDRCTACYGKLLRERNPDKFLNAELKKNYGITLEVYNEILENQNGKCALCGAEANDTINGKVARLAVDHNHETGEIRGLLCGNCNRGIGNLQDSTEILTKAIDYLQNHASSEA